VAPHQEHATVSADYVGHSYEVSKAEIYKQGLQNPSSLEYHVCTLQCTSTTVSQSATPTHHPLGDQKNNTYSVYGVLSIKPRRPRLAAAPDQNDLVRNSVGSKVKRASATSYISVRVCECMSCEVFLYWLID
jgi:hypothetical protein